MADTTHRRKARISARCMILGAAMFALLGSACKQTDELTPVATPSEGSAPSGLPALDEVNEVGAQGSVRTAIAVSGKIIEKTGTYQDVTVAAMELAAPDIRFVTPSTSWDEVSFDVRGDPVVAFAAMAPSGVCFGALDEGAAFSYTHSDAGQTGCDAADVPYPIPGWPGPDVAQT